MAFLLPPKKLEKRHNSIPIHSKLILTRHEPLPPLKTEPFECDPALKCHSVITSPNPHHQYLVKIDKSPENILNNFISNENLPLVPSFPKRLPHKNKIIIPKNKINDYNIINIAATKLAIKKMKKEKENYLKKNLIYDKDGNIKEIDSVYLNPMHTLIEK